MLLLLLASIEAQPMFKREEAKIDVDCRASTDPNRLNQYLLCRRDAINGLRKVMIARRNGDAAQKKVVENCIRRSARPGRVVSWSSAGSCVERYD